MTRDDIIKLAREAGMNLTPAQFSGVLEDEVDEFQLEHFAALVAAAEREACAKVCEQTDEDGENPDCWGWHSKDYAAAIRARSAA